ncbi:MAG: aminomethyl-transferring glycine dehydrogenase [Propionibacteriaceae bacterium]|jgi:glycine dehydrogenase|nr:aminomethyl-transferring glycine dehydrogenase [Propionibacteriaceae bacterium]
MAAPFLARHLGLDAAARTKVRAALGLGPDESIVERALPAGLAAALPDLPEAVGEAEVLAELQALAARNRPRRWLNGAGFYRSITPPVIQRLILENPAWYTAYTPYQPEISQGRLEALFTFQTMLADLTALPVANASLLDEATAAAEAMALCHRAAKGARPVFLVDADVFPHVRAVIETRAEPLGIDVVTVDVSGASAGTAAVSESASDGRGRPLAAVSDTSAWDRACGLYVQQVGHSGRIYDLGPLADSIHAAGGLLAVGVDPLALTLLQPPGEQGADIAVGSAQRFGGPLGYGGPAAAFMAVRDNLVRQMPGRLVGLSQDDTGAPALRLALVTREQHIRREKATSNICTASVLLAVVAAAYAIYHGPEGLTAIAERVHGLTRDLAQRLAAVGLAVNETYFGTLAIPAPGQGPAVRAAARDRGLDVWADPDRVLVSLDEAATEADVADLVTAVTAVLGRADAVTPAAQPIPPKLRRTSPFLTHAVFHSHRTELELTRYLKRLADRDFAMDRGMIPLGSCTMKLNPTVAVAPMTWPGFADLHPWAEPEDAAGTRAVIADLEAWLAEATGYAAVTLQPNAGAQGEFTGLLAIRRYHAAQGHPEKTVCLVPASAHGTNPASAAMAGFQVVGVATDAAGNVDLADLRAKLAEHAGRVGALMLTYPSTHGVYEAAVREVCDLAHAAGAQVYIDGANFNALMGWAQAGRFGGDISHLNLHKTFAMPHGGGGPGVGPVACQAHLAPYLPGRDYAVAAAPYGSPLVLPISWAYLRLLGGAGLKEATEGAVLAANYVAHRLDATFPVLYRGPDSGVARASSGASEGRDKGVFVAHECLLDLREFTHRTGVTVDDVAKRLMDFGFHAPTMSFPVAGTLMVEPTESESLAELDRFCDAMLAIAAEAEQVAAGEWAIADSPLRHAPHTAAAVTADAWDRPYSRRQGAFPGGVTADKYWPPVGRVDASYGDRHFVGVLGTPLSS